MKSYMSVLFGLVLGTFTVGCGDVPNGLDAVEVAESELAPTSLSLPASTATQRSLGVTRWTLTASGTTSAKISGRNANGREVFLGTITISGSGSSLQTYVATTLPSAATATLDAKGKMSRSTGAITSAFAGFGPAATDLQTYLSQTTDGGAPGIFSFWGCVATSLAVGATCGTPAGWVACGAAILAQADACGVLIVAPPVLVTGASRS